ncbi:hypothetical protein CAL14_04530 [Bordetella genomosp. 9]|uniref:hypothetical protein n=1 Tax=Bordetella genomosp. 9 TaxID=1416803 RepID=UPI000A2908C9|nr:hypothetical protein [Bordetella genomosp. 9]ARP89643.1 hypothetical protein CAL14_04530 [Bordetella genomosp. 9]
MSATALDPLAIHGIQFKVLAHVFPVLRHDALKPLSNAKLTIVLLEKAIAKGTLVASDPPPFVGDLDTMLDDSVAAIRLLNNWFQDESPPLSVHAILQECRRLAFSQLLLSGKKIQIDDFQHTAAVDHRSGRYVVMAWMIEAIHALPPRGVLHVRQQGPDAIVAEALPAPPDATGRALQPEGAPPISHEDMQAIAHFYGWKIERHSNIWLLSPPAAAAIQIAE